MTRLTSRLRARRTATGALLVLLALVVLAVPIAAITWGWKDTNNQYPEAGDILVAGEGGNLAIRSRWAVRADHVQGRMAKWQGTDFREREPLMDLGPVLLPQRDPFRYSVLLSGDGQWVAAGSTNGILQVWDLQRRAPRWRGTVSTGLTLPLEFLGQGKRLVLFDYTDKLLHEWDVTTGREAGAWSGTTNMWVVAFSQDGRWSLALDTEGNSFRRDAATSLVATQKLDLGWVDVASFSPDGRLVAAACSAGYAKVGETAALGQELARFRGFLLGAHGVVFSPDGSQPGRRQRWERGRQALGRGKPSGGFEREARVLATLSHPPIATIHGLEPGEDAPVLVIGAS